MTASFKRSQHNQSGFTLIEMMIALTILAVISVGVYNTTSSSFQLREKLETESDFYNSVRSALDKVGRDIIHLYTPQLSALPPSLAKQPNSNPNNQGGFNAPQEMFDPGQPSPFWGV